MHKVEIRLTNEGGDEPAANFELYTETFKDGIYVEMAPMRVVAGGSAPIVLFLEDAERVIVVAKTNVGRLVYDREQNANIRVETEDEIARKAEREKRLEARDVRAKETPTFRPDIQPQGSTLPSPKPVTPAPADTGFKDSKQVKLNV